MSTVDSPVSATFPGSSARALARLAQGTLLGDRYRIVRWLGQGAMGSVYQASDEARSGLQVAVKLLAVQHPQALYRLKNEFRALAQTVHPNLVGLHGLGTDAQGWFVVMDLIAPCSDFLSFARTSGERVDATRLRPLLAQLLRGVAAIHAAGKLHRDLKPSNVLVSDDGRVVIADFGLVGDQEPGGEGHTRDGWFVGTPAYAAPEQARGETIGTKADMYAVGVLLFEALTGRLPIEGKSSEELLERKNRESAPDLRELAQDVPSDLSALCNALLRRDPALRPEATEALLALEEEPAAPVPVAALRFVGRESELAQLHDAALSAERGAPLLAVVSGPSGIGKTALVTRFLEELRREPNTVQLRGGCHAHEHLPYNAFDALIDALGRYLTRLDPVEAASLMPRDVTMLARLFPTLLRVPAVLKMPAGRRAESDEAIERLRAFAALKELLARIADRARLVVCFDDLQWSDDDSRELLRELLRGPGAPGALFVCAARAGEPGEDAGIAALLHDSPGIDRLDLPLAPLEASAADELARAMLGDAPPHADLELLIREAAGSPFLVKELSRGKSQSDHVTSLPETVAAVTHRLGPDARSLLELVCTLRQPVELQLAMRAAGVAPQALPEILATSLVRTSLHGGREHLEGSHQRISEAVVAELTPARRAALHERFARALSAQNNVDPEQIAHHLRAAGLKTAAAPYTIAAARRAAHQLAFGRSAELYEVALADAAEAERAELELALAKIYEHLGKLNDAAEYCERAAQRAAAGPEQRELASRAMQFFLLAGQTERGMTFVFRLCRELGVPAPPRQRWLAALMRILLGLRFLCGRSLRALRAPRAELASPLARERLEFCSRVARGLFHSRPDDCTHFSLLTLIETRRLRDPLHWPLALAGEAMWRCVFLRESPLRYGRDLERSLALAEQRGDPDVVAGVLSIAGICAMTDGHWQQAVDTLERAESALKAVHRSPIQVFHVTRAGRMVVWLMTGQLTQIADHCAGWIAEARALGDHYCELSLRFLGAHAFLAQDDPEQARAEMEHVRATLGDDISTADAWWFGDVALYEGDGARALAEDRRARSSPHYPSLSRLPNHRILSAWYRGRASLLAAAQRLNEKQQLRSALSQARELARHKWPLAQGAAAQIRAGVGLLRGEHARARAELERALRLFTSSEVRLSAEATRFLLGKLRGDAQGEREMQEACAAARALGVHNPERWFSMSYPGAARLLERRA